MRCETSFFSLTLFKKELTRYWPLWGVWLAGWILVLPVGLWNAQRWSGSAAVMAADVKTLLVGTGPFIAMIAPLAAVCVFFYLFKPAAANFVGALPLRREGTFATAFCAGYLMLTGPLVAVTLLTLLVEMVLGAVAAGSLFTLLGGCLLQSFFWFSFATLCCVISGNGVAAVCFYGIFNGVVMVMTALLDEVLGSFLYGFDRFGQRVWEVAEWFTPFYKMTTSERELSAALTPVGRMEMLWVYAAVGFLMFLAALGLHHIRRAERAGDLIAFVPVRWLFLVSVTLCGGLSLGLLLLVIIFDARMENHGAPLAVCCAVAAAVSWYVAEMLLHKSFKVFRKHWKGAAVGALCFVVAICAIDMDWIGFTTWTPAPQRVDRATLTLTGDFDWPAREGLEYDSQSVSSLIDLHRYVAQNHPDSSTPADTDSYYVGMDLTYDMGLTTQRRTYYFLCPEGSELEALMETAQVAGLPQVDVDASNPREGYVSWRREDETEGWDELDPAQAERAWQAVVEDFRAGRYRSDPQYNNSYQSRDDAIELIWLKRDEKGYSYAEDTHTYQCSPRTTSMNRFLAELQAEKAQESQDEDALPDTEAGDVPPPDTPVPQAAEVPLAEAADTP